MAKKYGKRRKSGAGEPRDLFGAPPPSRPAPTRPASSTPLSDYLSANWPGVSEGYVVLPRSLAEGMSLPWQQQMAAMLSQFHQAHRGLDWPVYRVVPSRYENLVDLDEEQLAEAGYLVEIDSDGEMVYRERSGRKVEDPENTTVLVSCLDPIPPRGSARAAEAAAGEPERPRAAPMIIPPAPVWRTTPTKPPADAPRPPDRTPRDAGEQAAGEDLQAKPGYPPLSPPLSRQPWSGQSIHVGPPSGQVTPPQPSPPAGSPGGQATRPAASANLAATSPGGQSDLSSGQPAPAEGQVTFPAGLISGAPAGQPPGPGGPSSPPTAGQATSLPEPTSAAPADQTPEPAGPRQTPEPPGPPAAGQPSSSAGHASPPPVGQTSPPAAQTSRPVDQTLPPVGKTSPPADQTSPPADQTLPPVGQTSPPADQTLPPADRTSPPADQTPPQPGSAAASAEPPPSDADTPPRGIPLSERGWFDPLPGEESSNEPADFGPTGDPTELPYRYRP